MENRKLNILFLEEDVEGAKSVLYEMQRAGLECDYFRTDNLKDFKEKLFDFLPHVVISDYHLPTCNALDGLKLVQDIKIPYIIVSNFATDEEIASALSEGATDYINKDEISYLPLIVERALNEKKVGRDRKTVEHELIQSKERLELALEGTNLGVWDLDLKSNTIVYNQMSLTILGLPQEDAIKEFDYFQNDVETEGSNIVEVLQNHIEGKTPLFEQEFPIYNDKKAALNWVLVRGKIIRRSIEGEPLRASGTLLDITERKVYEEKLRKNQVILENAEAVAQIGSFEWLSKGSRFVFSEGFGKVFDLPTNDDLSVFSIFKARIHKQDKPFLKELYFGKKEYYDIEHRIIVSDGSTKVLRNSGKIKLNSRGRIMSVMGIVQDVTEQRDISKSIFNAQEFERMRIARDIHDGVGQMMVAAKFKLSSLEPEQCEGMIKKKEEIEDMLATTLEEVRRVSRNLSNRYLEDFGLEKTLEHLVEEMENFGLGVSYHFDIPKDYDMEVSNTIYRIAQEATNNVIKYAKATKLIITVESTDQNIILEVKDDGVGFDGAEINWNGIKNMKERASLHNGHFEISSEVGHGTAIKSWFPIKL